AGTGLVEAVVRRREELVDPPVNRERPESVVPPPGAGGAEIEGELRVAGEISEPRVLGTAAEHEHPRVVEDVFLPEAEAVVHRDVLEVVGGPAHVPVVADAAQSQQRLLAPPRAYHLGHLTPLLVGTTREKSNTGEHSLTP